MARKEELEREKFLLAAASESAYKMAVSAFAAGVAAGVVATALATFLIHHFWCWA